MTDSTDTTSAAGEHRRAGGKGLGAMLLPELRQLAGTLGIRSSGLRKGDLVEAIRAAQGGGQPARASRQEKQPEKQPDKQAERQPEKQAERQPDRQLEKQPERQPEKQAERQPPKQSGNQAQPKQGAQNNGGAQQAGGTQQAGDDDAGGSRRNRRRRGRDRAGTPISTGPQGGSGGGQQGGRSRGEPDLQILEDDVLAPCAGILDLLDNYAFVRTSGYLPGPDDVYVSMSMVRRFGLRRGDAVTGQVRQPREGERKEKYNPLVKIDSVNGAEPDGERPRPDFDELTPIYPTERLRLETTPTDLVGRVIDLVAPIGKGQRGLITAPAEAGRSALLQALAASITRNNPEAHLMVVLVDERPEEVTEFQRSIAGEVVSSTLDRPPADHTVVSELAIERAKRLVELGHDVVVLLDGITRLGRAYNLAAPANGRTLEGGVDASALHPPKRFFGAARNVEDGGSLTILAVALTDTGSAIDEVVLEEVRGAASSVLRLQPPVADAEMEPAIDPLASGTLREELLLGQEELEVVRSLRRTLAGNEPGRALALLLERVRRSQTNLELLTRVQRSAGPS